MEDFFSYVNILGPLLLGFLIFAWTNRRSVIELKEIELLSKARASYTDSKHAVVQKIDERIESLMDLRIVPESIASLRKLRRQTGILLAAYVILAYIGVFLYLYFPDHPATIPAAFILMVAALVTATFAARKLRYVRRSAVQRPLFERPSQQTD